MFESPCEIAFTIFNYPVHWYGIIMAIAILTGLFVVSLIRKKYYSDIPREFVLDLSFYLILGGIIGARLYYVILDSEFYINHPLEALAIWHGGLSIHGAIIGAMTTGAFYIKSKKYSFLKIADLFTYGLIVGQIIGRWGNFFNSEAFGKPTDLPWKIFIPIEARPINLLKSSFFHPTFLYESILNIFVLIILFFVVRKRANDNVGIIFFSYLVLYSVIRFFVENLRIDSVLNIYGMPVAQLVSIIFFIAGITGIIKVCSNQRK